MDIKKEFLTWPGAAALACAAGLGVVVANAVAPSANPPEAFGVSDGGTTPATALTAALGGNVKYAMEFEDASSWSSITQSWPYSSWKAGATP